MRQSIYCQSLKKFKIAAIFSNLTVKMFLDHILIKQNQCFFNLNASILVFYFYLYAEYRNFIVSQNSLNDYDEASSSSTLARELDGCDFGGPPTKVPRLDTTLSCSIEKPFVLVSTYVDPETKLNKCLVSLLLCPGVGDNVSYDVIEDQGRQTLKITYDWPKEMFDIEELCLDNIPSYHPKKLALEKSLESVRKNVSDTPQSCIKVVLPHKIDTTPKTWVKNGKITKSGSILITIEFNGIQNEYTIEKSDKVFAIPKKEGI